MTELELRGSGFGIQAIVADQSAGQTPELQKEKKRKMILVCWSLTSSPRSCLMVPAESGDLAG